MTKYQSYTINTIHKIPQVQQYLSEAQQFKLKVVAHVLPFKVNNYVIDQLIDWSKVPNDPIYQLTFPQEEMLSEADFEKMAIVLQQSPKDKVLIQAVANDIRNRLNPHPAGQKEHNIPLFEGEKLSGIQHKYRETLLFFPNHGQTCHAYCTFCFRWPQFVGMEGMKFASKEIEVLLKYLQQHPLVSDVLFTGGDPMIMSALKLRYYIEPLLDSGLPQVQNIRIGSKVLGFWPYKFLSDSDALDTLALFKSVTDSGKHLAFMAHFSHPKELETEAAQAAIAKVRSTGAEIRSQSPIMRGVNDDVDTWAKMWTLQVKLGCIPYYMFIARDTGAQDYFAVPLVEALEIFQAAYRKVSGIARSVRGPVMSTFYGKIMVMGCPIINGQKVMALQFLQGRNPEWAGEIFFAIYDPEAIWLDELRPAFGAAHFFFEQHEPSFL